MEHVSEYDKPPRITLKRSLIIFIGNIIGLYLISFFGLGVDVSRFDEVALFVIFISFINAIFWPILTRILMPFLVLTFGVGTLVLNGILLQIFAPFFDITITGWGVILAPLAMALLTTILSTLVTIEDTSSYYRSVLRDATKKRKGDIKKYPGVIIIEIDGLAYDVLCEAIDKGYIESVHQKVLDYF